MILLEWLELLARYLQLGVTDALFILPDIP